MLLKDQQQSVPVLLIIFITSLLIQTAYFINNIYVYCYKFTDILPDSVAHVTVDISHGRMEIQVYLI